MKSSWRWDSDEEFRENTDPQHINPVSHVRNYERMYSFAQCAREMYKDLAELRDANKRLAQALEATSLRSDLSDVHDIALDVCHHGERILLFQKRLALSDTAYGFLHSKDAIEHADHHPDHKATLIDFQHLGSDTDALLQGFDNFEREDVDYLVKNLDLPDDISREFRLARDLFSVGFDDVGLFIVGRGLEAVVRKIVRDRAVQIRSRGSDTPAFEARLHDVVEAIGKLRWKGDGSRFMSKEHVRSLQWLREVRNGTAHSNDGTDVEPREFAPVVATAANKLWSTHQTNLGRELQDSIVVRDWNT